MTPSTDFYKKLALDCSGQQVAVDLFLLSGQYSDLASLGKFFLVIIFPGESQNGIFMMIQMTK